ncbi:MAG: hypothetical protein ACLRWQ_09660 [Flavonifractor plautii]
MSKAAIVTGAAQGIGKAIAARLVKDGMRGGHRGHQPGGRRRSRRGAGRAVWRGHHGRGSATSPRRNRSTSPCKRCWNGSVRWTCWSTTPASCP